MNELGNMIAVAIYGSIKKWENIVAGVGEDGGTDDCPLCKIFKQYNAQCNITDGDRFIYCPIAEYASINQGSIITACINTPYGSWNQHVKEHCDVKSVHCKTCEKLANDELEFIHKTKKYFETVGIFYRGQER